MGPREKMMAELASELGLRPRLIGWWYKQYRLIEKGFPDHATLKWFIETEVEAARSAWALYYEKFRSDIFVKTIHFVTVFYSIHPKYYPHVPARKVYGEQPNRGVYWDDFVEARRAADLCNAIYEDWIEAIFHHYAYSGVMAPYRKIIPPSFFKSDKAASAYQNWAEEHYLGKVRGEVHPVYKGPSEERSIIRWRHFKGMLQEAQVKARIERKSPLQEYKRLYKAGLVPKWAIKKFLKDSA